MRRNRLNNGFVGNGQLQNSLTGCISLNKHAIDNLYVQQFVRPYSRPSEWVALPTVSASEQKVVLICAVYDNDSNFTSFVFQGNYTVDWGDGSGTSSFSSGVTAEKIYTRATYSALSSSVYRGYKTLLITITPQAGQNLTSMTLCQRHSNASLPSFYGQGILAVRMSAPNLTTAFFASADEAGSLTASNPMLEEIEWIGSAPLTSFRVSAAFKLRNIISFPSTRNCTSMSAIFYRCYSLQLLPPGMFETNSATDFLACFLDCTSLLEVPSFNTNACTSGNGMALMFTNCLALLRIGDFRSNHIKNFSQAFQNCPSLIEIPPIDISSSTDNSQMFSGAGSLREIKGNFATPSVSATNYNSMFANAAALQELPAINLANATTATSFMNGVRSVRSVPPLNMPLVTNTTSFFNNCTQLEEISGMTTGTALTNITTMFSDCRALKRIPNFNTSKVTNATSAFNACYSLTEVPNLDFSSITNMTTSLANTRSLARFQVTGITSASFSVAGAILGATQLNEIYTNLGTAAGSPTITVTGNWGTATDNTAIATGKGWTVSG
jgi:surface protein